MRQWRKKSLITLILVIAISGFIYSDTTNNSDDALTRNETNTQRVCNIENQYTAPDGYVKIEVIGLIVILIALVLTVISATTAVLKDISNFTKENYEYGWEDHDRNNRK